MLKEHGITIVKNTFLADGRVIYEDGFKNRVVARREEAPPGMDKFFIRLMFDDKNIKAAPLYVTIPTKDGESGQMLHLDYLNGHERKGKDIDSGIDMLTLLVQRWINLLYDIKFLQADPKLLQKAYEGATDEDIAYTKYHYISDYEELSELIEAIKPK